MFARPVRLPLSLPCGRNQVAYSTVVPRMISRTKEWQTIPSGVTSRLKKEGWMTSLISGAPVFKFVMS